MTISSYVDPSFKKVAKYLLKTDLRKHNRYCPCCRDYEGVLSV